MHDEKLPPGTVRLVDIEGNLLTKHAAGAERDVVLHPRPSEDPEDPLNWTYKRKILATSCVLVYTLMVAIPSGSVYSVVKPIQEATDLTLNDLNTGTGVMFLAYGWACVIWQPFSLQYGKRPSYLLSMLASIAIMAATPLCTHRSTYLMMKVLQGVFGAPVESLCEISISDIWFAHERPKYLAWYGFSLSITSKLAPTLAGFINDGQGWEWVLYWTSIWIGMASVYCFFLMEETNYDRPAREEPDTIETSSGVKESPVSEEKTFTSQLSTKQLGRTTIEPPIDTEHGQLTYARKTYLQKLSIVDRPRPNRMLDIFIAPFKGFTYPCIVYAGFMYGGNNLVWSGVQNATTGTVYTKFYGFSTTGVAGAYTGGIVGGILGSYYCGKVGRLLTLKLARRNGGISEPEHTLYMFVASMILVPAGMLLYGLGVTYKVHWIALVISQGMINFQSTMSVAGALGYAISSYHELSGELVTTCILIRNTLSFAVNYGITPWLNALGYRTTFIMVAVISFVWNASLFAMVRLGPWLRKRSADRYWKDVAKARAKGLSH